jgi:hypothetical protein
MFFNNFPFFAEFFILRRFKSALDSEERISWGDCLSFWKNNLDWKKKNKQKIQQNGQPTILLSDVNSWK